MLIKPEKVKESVFRKALHRLPSLVNRYESGQFETLGAICQLVCAVDEYCGRTTRKLRLAHEAYVSKYRTRVFASMTALVLRDQSDAYSYTRKDVVKFIRGEFAHGDSDNRDPRRLALHNFAFELSAEVGLEYAFTGSFVIFPGIRSSVGNTDSATPFIQRFNLDGRDVEVTQLESIALNAVIEYLQALQSGSVLWNHRVAMTNDLDPFRGRLGDKIVDSIASDWANTENWRKTGHLEFS